MIFDELFIFESIIVIIPWRGLPCMKKFFKGLIITLVVLIILPIALVFIFLFDTGKMNVKYNEDFTVEDWSKSLVVDSLDYAPTNAKAKFIVTEQDINNFIHSQIKNNTLLQKYLTQLAIDIKSDSYVLNVSGKAFFFETRAKLTAKLSKETIGDKEAFVLSVDKMQLGRLSQLKPVIMFFLQTFVNNETIDALTNSIKLHTDLENARMYFYISDFREMLNKSVNGGSGTSEFYFSFINSFFDMNLVSIDFYADEALNVNVNLEPLIGNDYGEAAGENVYYPMKYEDTTTSLTIKGEEKKLSLNTIRDAVVSLLDDRIIEVKDMTAVSNYLFDGYNGSNAPEFNLSSIGITNKETYPGFALATSASVDEILGDGIATFSSYSPSLSSFDIASLTENQINLFLKTQSALGIKYFLQRAVGDSKNKVNYIAIDNAYMNLYGDDLAISVGMNINGLETFLTIKMKLDNEASANELVYKISKVYFGKEEKGLEISEDTRKVIFNTMAEAVNNESFKFSNDGTMTISFAGIIDAAIDAIDTSNPVSAQYKNFLRNNADLRVVVQGDNVTDNSVIKIQATRH